MQFILAAILLFACSPAIADSGGEAGPFDISAERTLTAADVIADLYQFDEFQQGTIENVDTKGNQELELRNVAALRVEDAAKRDRILKQIRTQIGKQIDARKRGPTSSAGLADPDEAEGPAYVRRFYAAQISEYRSAVALLERYLKAPDNEALHAFASEATADPAFRAERRRGYLGRQVITHCSRGQALARSLPALSRTERAAVRARRHGDSSLDRGYSAL